MSFLTVTPPTPRSLKVAELLTETFEFYKRGVVEAVCSGRFVDLPKQFLFYNPVTCMRDVMFLMDEIEQWMLEFLKGDFRENPPSIAMIQAFDTGGFYYSLINTLIRIFRDDGQDIFCILQHLGVVEFFYKLVSPYSKKIHTPENIIQPFPQESPTIEKPRRGKVKRILRALRPGKGSGN